MQKTKQPQVRVRRNLHFRLSSEPPGMANNLGGGSSSF